jgi:hypothetical protein
MNEVQVILPGRYYNTASAAVDTADKSDNQKPQPQPLQPTTRPSNPEQTPLPMSTTSSMILHSLSCPWSHRIAFARSFSSQLS